MKGERVCPVARPGGDVRGAPRTHTQGPSAPVFRHRAPNRVRAGKFARTGISGGATHVKGRAWGIDWAAGGKTSAMREACSGGAHEGATVPTTTATSRCPGVVVVVVVVVVVAVVVVVGSK